MIPKVIHYCWLSGDPYPDKIARCMATWRQVMPHYKIKLWNTSNFDIGSAPAYVQQAFAQRKWAFAADYIRMWALYTEGGIYLDSDVRVLKPFDDMLGHNFFSSMEYHPSQVERMGSMAMIDAQGRRIKDGYVSGIQIQAAVMGAQAGCRYVKDVLDDYEHRTFEMPSGTQGQGVLSPFIYARVMERYGLRYVDRDQQLDDGIMIYRSEVFAGNKHEATPASYAIHYCAHSWKPALLQRLAAKFGRSAAKIGKIVNKD